MELKELIKYARDNRCSDLHITAGEAVAVRKYGELQLLDITPSIEETEDMIFSILGDEDIQNVQAGKDMDVLVSQVDHSVEKGDSVAGQLETLDKYIEEMHSIVELISGITSQTSLLALNASIEVRQEEDSLLLRQRFPVWQHRPKRQRYILQS